MKIISWSDSPFLFFRSKSADADPYLSFWTKSSNPILQLQKFHTFSNRMTGIEPSPITFETQAVAICPRLRQRLIIDKVGICRFERKGPSAAVMTSDMDAVKRLKYFGALVAFVKFRGNQTSPDTIWFHFYVSGIGEGAYGQQVIPAELGQRYM